MTLGIEMSLPAGHAGPDPGSELPDVPHVLESRGWSADSVPCAPKIAALASLTALPAPEPVARVSYQSHGNVLVVGGEAPELARSCAERLARTLPVTFVQAGNPAPAHGFTVWSGRIESLSGYLGEFTAVIEGVASAAGAAPARFDLVLDFSSAPLFAMRQPPQGYFRGTTDAAVLERTLADLREAVGEFEKPRYFALRESICAHSRSEVTGCTACIDACSTGAISPDGNHVKVDPHLCMGCGTCATVCPSGAMSYQYPRVPERGAQLKHLLAAYRKAGGADACIVFHDGGDGRELLGAVATSGGGLPGRAIPLETWSVAAIGLDLLLPAIAYGASQVVILCAGAEGEEEKAALRAQIGIGEAILGGLGRPGRHFALLEAHDAASLARAFEALEPPPETAPAATFLLSADKRTSIEFALEHLLRLASPPPREIALPAGSPYGEVRVDAGKCTMCMSCVGACPESALMDGVDEPLLKFVERNCVQCGLCEATCPEDAITLSPRLLLGAPARETRVLNRTEPFHCVRCDKPFGTRQMIEAMVGRLAGHSMFSRPEALRRLQMCADCRVIDMMSSTEEASVLKLGADS
jgi:ferredoxin